MRISFTLFLAVIALALSAAAVLFTDEEYRDSIFGKTSSQPGEKLFDTKALDKVRQITLTNSDGDLANFIVENNQWLATKPWQDRVDPLYLRALVQFTALLQVEDVIPRRELELEECGLRDNHVRITMRDTNGKAIADYQIGRQAAWHIKNEDTRELMPTIFIQLLGKDLEKNIYVCSEKSADAIHRLFNDQFKRFRDHHPFYFNPKYLDKINIQNTQGDVIISRKDINSAWAISKPLELRVDPASLNTLFTDLAKLTAIRVEDRANVTLPTGEDSTAQARELSLRFADTGKESILRIYPPAEESDSTVLATVSDRPDAVFELPLTAAAALPDTSSLSQLQSGVNDLRSKTMTHLNGPQIKTIIIKPTGLMPVMLERTPKTTWRVLRRSGREEANQNSVINLMTAVTKDKIQKFVTDAATDLTPYGLNQPFLQIAFISFNNEGMRVAFGRDPEQQNIYAHIVGKPNIWQISSETLAKIALHPWQWRTAYVWHIPKVDITAISIEKKGVAKVNLGYNHFTGIWRAEQDGVNATGSLNPNRADKLLESITSLKADRWLGPMHPQAIIALEDPDIIISVSLSRQDDEGNDLPPVVKTLRVARTPGGYINFCKIDSIPLSPDQEDENNYFLISSETIKKLSVNLFK